MGGCTSNVYSLIKKDHGENFKKYIVDSESLTLFKRQMKTKLEEFDKKVEKRTETLHAEVAQREEMMMYHFNETKLKLDGSIPGGIADYEQMKKVNIDNLLGLHEYKARFGTVHQQINKQVKQRRQKIRGELQQIVRKADEEYTIDPEKMSNFHEMSEQKRGYVRQRGVKEYEADIKNKIMGLQTKYGDQLSLDEQLKKFESVVALERVDQLAKMAQNKFTAEAVSIMGGNMDSAIDI